MHVFHIASLYDRRSDTTAGAEMIDHNSKTALHDVTSELIRVVLYIDNVQQPTNWRQIRPTRE